MPKFHDFSLIYKFHDFSMHGIFSAIVHVFQSPWEPCIECLTKTDQTAWMCNSRLIWVFAVCICQFVGIVTPWLICLFIHHFEWDDYKWKQWLSSKLTVLSWLSLVAKSVSNLSLRSCSDVDSRWAFKYLFSRVAILSSWSSFWAIDWN